MSWRGRFRDGRAHGAGGSAVPGGIDAAAVSFLVVTGISRLAAWPGYAAAAQAPAWAAGEAGHCLPLACDAAA